MYTSSMSNARAFARFSAWRAPALAALVAVVSACSPEVMGDSVVAAPALPPADVDAGPLLDPPCTPAVASEHLPARAALMGGSAQAADEGIHVAALFAEFKTHCGDCHMFPASLGQFSLTQGAFLNSTDPALVAKINKTIQMIRQEDPAKVMPKGGPTWSQRAEDDPVRQFAGRLEQWLAAGRPQTFYPTGGNKSAKANSPYRLTPAVGMNLTNMGNCVPVGRSARAESDEVKALDAKFAAMETFKDLPKSLAETDLISLDAEVLAKNGIYAYAPAYTLWADNAKKMRFIRVPVGTSIKFEKDTQTFNIPPNTRFYKTFVKETTDLEGNKRYRKLETRIIVARPSRPGPDGTIEQTALFGTYKWNEEETEAILNDKPYRDGQGFQDEIIQYVVDEQLDDEALSQKSQDQLSLRIEKKAVRNYAIPGYDRCMHCHMGATKQDFVLGFSPLQIRRRPKGEGGVTDAVERDELNQLQRLTNYGLITGITSADEVVTLEKSQGDREPRNEHELNAQAYMVGNCAHCHNPVGFPSSKEQVMKEDLNFLPSPDGGGIFQFPLEKMSRRTYRGAKQDIQIPYITPSLFDFTSGYLRGAPDDKLVREGIDKLAILPNPSVGFDNPWILNNMIERDAIATPLYAPWRSLIYRNVDAPFSYEEDGTVYPHMPMDTPAYDCRARKLLGTWMVSIPSRWKLAGETRIRLLETGKAPASVTLQPGQVMDEGREDPSEQPYREVTPDELGYLSASLAAEKRLADFTNGVRWRDCPDAALDILDPDVAKAGNGLPAALSSTVKDGEGREISYSVNAPARPHYFPTDLRISNRWILRRGDWYASLVENKDAYTFGADKVRLFTRLRDSLMTVKVDDYRSFATTRRPFGLWKNETEKCQGEFAKRQIPRVSDFANTPDRPSWMMKIPATSASNTHVYMTSPGEHVFDLICSKCHGPKGDGQSALASTIADLTGGLTRVANLRDGFFGPLNNPGANRQLDTLGFGVLRGKVVLDAGLEDWAARYVAWMGLGGTRAYIPSAAVAALSRFDVLGEVSNVDTSLKNATAGGSTTAAANMLTVAQGLCSAMITGTGTFPALFDIDVGQLSRQVSDRDKSGGYKPLLKEFSYQGLYGATRKDYWGVQIAGLIPANGHQELWEDICSFRNPGPVRVINFEAAASASAAVQEVFSFTGTLLSRQEYPAAAPVGGVDGKIEESLGSDNLMPWCVLVPSYPEGKRRYDEFTARHPLPPCPAHAANPTSPLAVDEREVWAQRGAVNAGVSVFMFLDEQNKRAFRGEQSIRSVAYDRCEDLAKLN